MRNVANESYVLVTGGCGFVGTNLAHRLLSAGQRVCVFDNLSRAGVRRNLEWLQETHGDRLIVKIGDTRDAVAVRDAVRRASQVFHFAAQVAVTTSLDDPIEDFEVNARGTLNVLEAVRTSIHRPPLFFTSTNKVYGGLDDVGMVEDGERYTPRNESIARYGISEHRSLDFHSPYGCSKGSADQYVRDYARTYGLKTVVFRMSCIYGPQQYGNEDQGWVAHFLIQAIEGRPIMLYGDGKQVRDLLFVDDLVDAFLLAQKNMPALAGQAFNIGGGASNTVSLLELLDLIGGVHGERPEVATHDWRVGDQRYYVSDTAKFGAATGWKPTVDVEQGVARLYHWLVESGTAAVRRRAPQPRPVAAARPRTTAEVGDGAAASQVRA
ncbi:MAG TPA: GDP-mannose 4,6-dehydratase [Thermoanaerobaculia bacterium]